MAARPTLKDVAEAAGVSIATVNRVVAGTGGVREETAVKVAEAAARIGYHGRTLLARQVAATLPEVRLGFILQKEKQAFYRDLAQHIEAAVAAHRGAKIRVELVFAASAAPRDVADMFASMAGRVDAVAGVAVNHHAVTDAVAHLAEKGVPTFSLLSDFGQGIRKSYLGTNNLKVGRGAANMLSAAAPRPGKIALFVGGYRWHGHELREMGFRAHFREAAPEFRLLDTFVNLETRQLTYEATLDLLGRHPDLAGIYLAGGGMEGAIAALREERPPGKVALVTNEWTAESRAAMEDRYVSLIIGTPLETLSRRLVEMMVDSHLRPATAMSGQVFLDPVLYLPEFF